MIPTRRRLNYRIGEHRLQDYVLDAPINEQ